MNELFDVIVGEGPLVAVAIHNGHDLRPEVRDLVALSDDERLREEDPSTGDFTDIAPTRFTVHRSRFEMDLNRPLESAIYKTPEDAWGLNVWKGEIAQDIIDETTAQYIAFYDSLRDTLMAIERTNKRFVVLDFHSYNHRREGADGPAADPAENPEINVGTGSMDRKLWAPVVDTFLKHLSQCEVQGRPLDVRENIRFKGGHLSRWVHENFPQSGCALAIEIKKTYMDEWTGKINKKHVAELKTALKSVAEPVVNALRSVKSRRTKAAPRPIIERPISHRVRGQRHRDRRALATPPPAWP